MREPSSDTTDGAAKPAKRKLKRLLKGLLLTALILLVTGAVLVQWGWPAYLRKQIRRELAVYWAGPIDIGKVSLGWSGPLTVHDIVLRDSDGNVWVKIPEMEAQLTAWPGIKPAITELRIDALRVRADLSQAVPIRLAGDEDDSDTPNPLRGVHLTNASITVTQADGGIFTINPLAVDLTKLDDERHDAWEYSLTGQAVDDGFDIAGRLDVRMADGEREVSILTTTLMMDRGKLTGTLQLADSGSQVPGEQILTGDILWRPADGKSLSITSRCRYLETGPEQHDIHTDATVIVAGDMDQTFTSDVALDLSGASDTPITLYLSSDGGLLDGEAATELDLTFDRDFHPSWRCRGFANAITVGRMRPYLDIDERYDTGKLNYATWDLRGREPELATITGGIYVRMSDITFVPGSILFELLNAITPDFPSLETADVTIAAGLAGPVVTFETAQVGGEVLAISADPGGTAHLETRELDMLVSVVLLRDLDALFEEVPILGPLTDISKHLTRTRVTGPWDDPTLETVPVDNMGESVLELLDDLLQEPATPAGPLP